MEGVKSRLFPLVFADMFEEVSLLSGAAFWFATECRMELTPIGSNPCLAFSSI